MMTITPGGLGLRGLAHSYTHLHIHPSYPQIGQCSCTVFPVEFVMRGYITGSTGTSLWTNYNKGEKKERDRGDGIYACLAIDRPPNCDADVSTHTLRLSSAAHPNPTLHQSTKGVRQYCGHALPDGLVKNQKLAQNLLTPTTKVIFVRWDKGMWMGSGQ